MTAARAAVAVVPAAGAGRRFGGQKLLADIGGEPMITRTVRSLLEADVEAVAVVVAPESEVPAGEPGRAGLDDPRVRLVVNRDPSRGMLSSIQVGLEVVDGEPVLVLPGDMPFVRPGTIAAVIAEARARAVLVSPRFDGRRGHPVALTATAAAAVERSTASDLSAALEAFKADRFELDVDDPGIHRDVDRREDLEG